MNKRRPLSLLSSILTLGLLLTSAARATSTAGPNCVVPSALYGTIQSALNDSGCLTVSLVSQSYGERITISRPVVLIGQGSDVTILDGQNSGPIVNIQQANGVTLARLRLTNGRANAGAALFNVDSTVFLEDVVISGNNGSQGAGIFNQNSQLLIEDSSINANAVSGGDGGGLLNDSGTVTVINSSLSFNTATQGGGIKNENGGNLTLIHSLMQQNMANNGGAIASFGGGTITIRYSELKGNRSLFGGAITSLGALTIDHSLFSGNIAESGGAIGGSGVIEIDSSTFASNQANALHGGALHIGVPALFRPASAAAPQSESLHIHNSTFAGNFATVRGGALYTYFSLGPVGIVNCTFAANMGQEGSGVANDCGTTLTLANTLLSAAYGTNCAGPITSLGHNLADDASCQLTAGGDLPNTVPLLDQLAHNGGVTPTLHPLPGSPAIDQGGTTLCPHVDQRGYLRPMDGDLNGSDLCDIGAVEVDDFSHSLFLPLLTR